MWAGHAPHHQSEEYNFTTALRQGAFQDATHFPIFFLMALMGCAAGVFIILHAFSKFYQFWIHTRLVDQAPVLSWAVKGALALAITALLLLVAHALQPVAAGEASAANVVSEAGQASHRHT